MYEDLSYLCVRPDVLVTVIHISHVIDEIQELWNHSKERISRREQENAQMPSVFLFLVMVMLLAFYSF